MSSPAVTKAGMIRWAGDSSVSRTRERKVSVLRRRRMRVEGKGIPSSLDRWLGSPAMEARDLVKRFGDREALRGVSFAAQPGELVAIIGPNGAGKTTLLSILAGILDPDGGELIVGSGAVGWVPQQAALYRRLTVEENLLLFARLEKHPDPRASGAEMLELTGLGDRRGGDGAPPPGGH